MTLLEITMIVIGLAAVIISFRISDTPKSENENEENKIQDIENLIDSKKFVKEVENKLQTKMDNIVEKADDKLSSMLNEKIMGFSEYSDQIFDKMEKNHGEEVFLYNMLGEKEKELKELMHDADASKASLREKVVNDYRNAEDIEDKSSLYDEEIKRIEMEERKNQLFDDNLANAADNIQVTSSNNNDTNKNIIELYKKGRSVLEISKMLSIGQGEVKFVIDLYNAR